MRLRRIEGAGSECVALAETSARPRSLTGKKQLCWALPCGFLTVGVVGFRIETYIVELQSGLSSKPSSCQINLHQYPILAKLALNSFSTLHLLLDSTCCSRLGMRKLAVLPKSVQCVNTRCSITLQYFAINL